MVVTAVKLQYKILSSELEALLTEAELIRTYQPPFNILLKDDKSPLYIHITAETFPRVVPLRKKELNMMKVSGTILGPFPSSTKVREVLTIARHIFPWCNNPLQATPLSLKLLRGTAGLRQRVTDDLSLPNIQYPISPPASAMLKALRAGNIETKTNTDTKTKTMKPCFYHHLQLCPGACIGAISKEEYKENIDQLILFLKGKKKTVTKVLEQQMKTAVIEERFEKAAQLRDKLTLITEVTSTRYLLKPETILPSLLNTSEDAIMHLGALLNQYLLLPLTYPISRIEGYDVSNTSGTLASVSMVTFIDGQADTNEYRLFNIRGLQTPNDFQMMKEAVARRQNHPEWGKPDVILIDGGKGQLRSALSVWGWDAPVVSIAKDPDRLIIPKINWPEIIRQQPRNYDFLKKLDYAIIALPEGHPTLKLIQQIRNESHRFSKKQHTRRREKQMFK